VISSFLAHIALKITIVNKVFFYKKDTKSLQEYSRIQEAVSAGWAAEGAGGRAGAGERIPGADTGADTGANTSGDGALRGDKACGGAGAHSASNGDDFSNCRGGSSSNSIAGWHGVDGDVGSGGEGGEKHPSICGICLFF
jgi:hypothetical protein